MVARTHLNLTLNVHCLYCSFHDTDKLDTRTFHSIAVGIVIFQHSLYHCQRPSATREQEHVFFPGKSSLPPVQPLAHGTPLCIVTGVKCPRRRFLTFRNRASYIYIGRPRSATIQMLHFLYFFNKYKY
jgi:hypothetical protein